MVLEDGAGQYPHPGQMAPRDDRADVDVRHLAPNQPHVRRLTEGESILALGGVRPPGPRNDDRRYR
jgi:hypothetical protein